MRIAYLILLFTFSSLVQAENQLYCQKGPNWAKKICKRFRQIWHEGNTDLYLTGYAWHNRYTYTREKIDSYNELAWGGGLGKGFYDEDGDWHGLFAMAFLDSHKNIEPALGYAFLKVAHLGRDLRLGAGYMILGTSRPDIFNNIPIIGALPWAAVGYKQLTVLATYIPGSQGNGNVLFVLAKIALW